MLEARKELAWLVPANLKLSPKLQVKVGRRHQALAHSIKERLWPERVSRLGRRVKADCYGLRTAKWRGMSPTPAVVPGAAPALAKAGVGGGYMFIKTMLIIFCCINHKP